nr:MAG TPA: hypothetical protein [Bacteriophage sp.]
MANYEVQIKLRTDGAYSNLYPTVPPAVSEQITKNAQDISTLKNKALPAKPNQRLYYNAAGGGSAVVLTAPDLLKYSCVVATVKTTDGTIINTAPMYFNGNTAKGFASEWGAASVKCVVNVVRHQPNNLGETGELNVWGSTGSGAGGSLIALIGVI